MKKSGRLGFEAIGLAGALYTTAVLGGHSVAVLVFNGCSENGRERAMGSALGAWDCAKLSIATAAKIGSKGLCMIPSCGSSCFCECDPDLSCRTFVDLTCFAPSASVAPSAPPHNIPFRAQVRQSIAYSPPLKLIRALTNTPPLPELEPVVAFDDRGAWMETVESLENGGKCAAVAGAVMNGLHGIKEIGVRGTGASFALVDALALSAAYLPTRLIGCCSPKASVYAEVLGKSAMDSGEIFLITTGRILTAVCRDAPAYLFSSCLPTEECVESCDDACYPRYIEAHKPKAGENAPSPRANEITRMRQAINNSSWRNFLRWTCGASTFNSKIKKYLSSAAGDQKAPA